MSKHLCAGILLLASVLCPPVYGQESVFRERRIAPLLGTSADALVGIEVSTSAKDDSVRRVRRGNGLVLRPDGFVLAPTGLFSLSVSVAGGTEEVEEQRITIILYPGTDHEKRVQGRRPRHFARGIGYAVLKLDDTETTAVRTLLPDSLAPADSADLCWSAWDESSHRFLPLQRRQVKLAPPDADQVKDQPGLLPFEQPQEGVPAGAAVFGPDGMAIGLVPGGGASLTAPAFWSMAVLNRVTNCVTPLPMTDSGFQAMASRQDAPPSPPMVQVPGGQFIPAVAVSGEQPDLEGAITCSIAPFLMDKFQVTNEQYLAYWRTLPREKQRMLGFRSNYYPSTWAPYPTDPAFPEELAGVPVIGVPLPGAAGYAKWCGKRLPTPYEWSLAALGPRGETSTPTWMTQYVADHQSVWHKIRDLHAQYLDQHRELLQRGVLLNNWNTIPWITVPSLLVEASVWSRETVDRFVDEQMALWRDPLYVLPIGLREYDLSQYGVADLIMNGSELVQPLPGPPALGNARYMEVRWMPEELPTPREPWTPRKIDANTDGPALQPLSRLWLRKVTGPTVQDLLMWSSLNDVVQMMTPLQGWQVYMTGASRSDVTMWPRGMGPYSLLGRPSGFDVWRGMPRHFHREMGRDVPLERPEPHPTPGPQLFYYLPTTFRCVR